MKPRLLITIDTELSNFPDAQGLWGRVGNEDWGLERLLDEFDDLRIAATFFVDVYAGDARNTGEQRRAVERIHARGHDAQLHTHPGPAFDPARPRLRDYTLAEQQQIIESGCRRMEQWTGVRPVLHRAGDWGADNVSLEALKRCGMRADFSASPWSRHCGIVSDAIADNGWARIDGLLCGLGTCYRDRITGRTRRVDLGGASFREVRDIVARGIDPLFITLHSFSLMHFNRTRTRFSGDAGYLKRLRSICAIARERHGYQISTALEAVHALEGCADKSLPRSALPTSTLLSSGTGILKSVSGRIMSALS